MAKKLTLDQRYEKLDDMMKMWFRQETMIKAWNISADRKNREAREFNETKHWWQLKRAENFPHYYATPIKMPVYIPVPPSQHPQYAITKKLIEDYVSEIPT